MKAQALIVSLFLISSASAFAQSDPNKGEGDGGNQAEVQPPEIIFLPQIRLPHDSYVSSGDTVTLAVVIEATGDARVDGCEAEESNCKGCELAEPDCKDCKGRKSDCKDCDAQVSRCVECGANGSDCNECQAAMSLCELARQAVAAGRFRAARRMGVPIASRVGVVVDIVRARDQAEPGITSAEEGPSGEEGEWPTKPGAPANSQIDPTSDERVVESKLLFSARAEIESTTHKPLELDAYTLQNVPGALGEPFRALEILPGSVPLLNGQPYLYIRGAPPSGTSTVYDGIVLPLLFHSAVGPTVLHSELIGDIKQHAGAPPARFGRITGAVNEALGPVDVALDRVHGGFELRVIDTAAMLRVPVGQDGSVTTAARIGYPNGVFKLFNAGIRVDYWNYQHRQDFSLGNGWRLQLVALGARDSADLDDTVGDGPLALDQQFHRVELRALWKSGRWQAGSALLYGYDRTQVEESETTTVPQIQGNLHRVGPRVWGAYTKDNFRFRLGADYYRLFGRPDCADETMSPNQLTTIPVPCDEVFAEIDRRSIGGVYAELEADPVHWLSLGLGIRTDIWATGGNREVGIDPRVRLTFHPTDFMDVFAAYGLVHQPAVIGLPLPGFGDVGLEPGLQSTHQFEWGLRFELPQEVELEVRGFLNIYRNLRFFDFFTERAVVNDLANFSVELDPEADGRSIGAEFWVSRPFGEGFAGSFSYTLAFTDLEGSVANQSLFFDLTPTYDVRHIMNAVLSWESSFGLLLAARLSARSGRAEGWAFLDSSTGTVQQYVQRLPWFYRLDATVAYVKNWTKARVRLMVGLEWINITRRAEPQDLLFGIRETCLAPVGIPDRPCDLDYLSPIFIPNLFVRFWF